MNRTVEQAEASPPTITAADLGPQTFPERRLWRDATDFLLFVLVAPLITAVVGSILAAAALLAFACLRLAGWNSADAGFASVLVGLAVLIDVALLIHLSAFRSATVTPEGLLFRRYVGPAVRVAWGDLVRVSVPPRAEVGLRVFVWPGFPPRGSLLCGSSRQFLLEWRDGRYYFGPQDMDGFAEAIRLWRPDLTAALHPTEWRP